MLLLAKDENNCYQLAKERKEIFKKAEPEAYFQKKSCLEARFWTIFL